MASINSMNSMFETAEQRAEREKYEAERKAFFESIPKRAEQTLIVGQSSESLVEELRKQLSELGVLRALDLQRIAALESELAAIQRVAEQYQDEAGKLTHDLAQARAECERLRADAERYRWLRDNALGMDSVADPDNMVQVWHGTDPALQSYGKTLDAAIDAALARWEA